MYFIESQSANKALCSLLIRLVYVYKLTAARAVQSFQVPIRFATWNAPGRRTSQTAEDYHGGITDFTVFGETATRRGYCCRAAR